MKDLVSMLPVDLNSLLECTPELCGSTEPDGDITPGDKDVYSEDEIASLRNSSIILGFIFMFEAYTPLVVWYTSRRTVIQKV